MPNSSSNHISFHTHISKWFLCKEWEKKVFSIMVNLPIDTKMCDTHRGLYYIVKRIKIKTLVVPMIDKLLKFPSSNGSSRVYFDWGGFPFWAQLNHVIRYNRWPSWISYSFLIDILIFSSYHIYNSFKVHFIYI